MSQKSPFQAPQGKWGFFDSKRPFWGPGKRFELFWPWNPLLPIFEILTPVGGGRVRKQNYLNDRRVFGISGLKCVCVCVFGICVWFKQTITPKTHPHKGDRNSIHGDGFGTNGSRPWDKPGPVPETNRPFSVEFHRKIGILSRLSLGRVGVRPWPIVLQGPSEKGLCVFFIGFFRPQLEVLLLLHSSQKNYIHKFLFSEFIS